MFEDERSRKEGHLNVGSGTRVAVVHVARSSGAQWQWRTCGSGARCK